MRERVAPRASVPSLAAAAAARLERFRPPFAFGDFFAPEDTLLCVLAAEHALARHAADRGAPPRAYVELTCGSAVVALAPFGRWPALRAWG
ncbi:hypothetical protein, partial [Roseisolibacter sp. H3M3-2]|uniref:hypothetical protein n=1 Tax=Roseisolibacter sp. H3M3-2 TaxID=3031323 RepID=UPI0023DA3529